MSVVPVTLEGRHVRLEPLSQAHHAGLSAVGLDGQLWRWIPTPVRTSEEMSAYIVTALDEQSRGVSAVCADRKIQRPGYWLHALLATSTARIIA